LLLRTLRCQLLAREKDAFEGGKRCCSPTGLQVEAWEGDAAGCSANGASPFHRKVLKPVLQCRRTRQAGLRKTLCYS